MGQGVLVLGLSGSELGVFCVVAGQGHTSRVASDEGE